MKTNLKQNFPLLLLMLAFIIGGASCKSKKNMSDVSDPNDKPVVVVEEEEPEPEVEEEPEMDARTMAENKLTNYFSAISSAPSVTSANKSIQEALNLFNSPDALVLIIISETNGNKDYDKPTTIKEYLNYLKDQKKNINSIDTFKMNDSGRITELELKKQ